MKKTKKAAKANATNAAKAASSAKAPDLVPSVLEALQKIRFSLDRLAEVVREGNRLRARPTFPTKR